VRNFIKTCGSLRIAIFLIALLAVALAAGTIVESWAGTPVAQLTVYGAAWFRFLLALLGMNIACSILDLWPWGRARIGFLVTHVSILLILAGSIITDRFKVEGRMEIWEGDTTASMITSTGPAGADGPARDLPFRVRLDAFEIDTYPGTMRPAMFRSRVTVEEIAAGRSFPAVIEMNRELEVAGFRLFQSSYQQTGDRDQTVLTVARDPGQPIVFAGYILLVLGMSVVLGTRIAQRVAATRRAAQEVRRVRRRAAVVALPILMLVGSRADAAPVSDPALLDRLRAVPVQHDGRVMPLDTLAREAVWNITGRNDWAGTDPVALAVDWSVDPHRWAREPMVRVKGRDLIAAAGLDPGAGHVSFERLAGNQALLSLFDQARAAAQRERALPPALAQAQALEERLVWLQGFLSRATIRVIPDPAGPTARWGAPASFGSAADLLAAAAQGDALSRPGPAPAFADAERIAVEIRSNRLRPSRIAWWLLAGATLASLLAWRGRRGFDVAALAGLLAGFAVMTWGIAARWRFAGRIPASNMYESLLFLGWGVGLFALVALLVIRNRLVIFNASAMAALTMALTDLLPIDPFVHPMPPVLSGTPWLAIHVPIIMVSYSVLALGVLIAHMQIGLAIVAPRRHEVAFRMNDLLYWYLHVGSILLLAGILTGSIWAASSWGRYWGWDPKEVWSLVAFLAYVGILHGRFDRLIGPFGVAVLSIVAFWTILMTYLGVNFILTQGLHSYGFGGGSLVRWMIGVAIAEAFFLVVGWLSYRQWRGRAGVAPVAA
jgi:cytochrome c-type biogenesis protein CcsB